MQGLSIKSGRLYLVTGGILLLYMAMMLAAGNIFPRNRVITIDPADRQVAVNGSGIRYRQLGIGKPVVILLHGFGGSLDGWQPIQNELQHYTVYALDLIGFGGSDAPAITYDLETHRRYLIGFMDQLNIKQAILVGGSMGGSIAAWTAAHSPERISGVVMIAPSGFPGSLQKPFPFNWFFRPGLPNKLAGLVVRNPLYRLFFPNSIAQQALDVTSAYDQAFVDVLGKIKQPVLLAWSSGDRTALYEFRQQYQHHLPQAELITLPKEYAHKALRADPQGIATMINKFIKRVMSAGQG
ncbi:MAG: alpha/beta hydrolase [Gammaproteobacteria bacterium]|nr:alpha/beta hydrolase [Gammaproteobacteria bacterium]MDH5651328.1 alpha/beta hydrolase [Gammaproteobacteria bacterium]